MKSPGFLEGREDLKHPESFSPEYNILMNAKLQLVSLVMERNPFKSNFFYWMDISYGHGKNIMNRVPKGSNWVPHNIMTEPFSDKVSIIALNNLDNVTSIRQFYKKNRKPVLSGGFYGGSMRTMRESDSLYTDTWERLLDQRVVDDDQTVMLECVLQNKQLFNLVRGDWFDAFRLFH